MAGHYIYMDHAATAWKIPPVVIKAAAEAMEKYSGNPKRGGHAVSRAAAEAVERARWTIAKLIRAERPERIIFTSNATEALNTAIMGIAVERLKKGISYENLHVICSSMEHNSVARPLEYLKSLGAEVTEIAADINNGVNPEQVKRAIGKNTCLVAMSSVSNVTGTVNPIKEIGSICRAAGIPYLVDGSQAVGTMPIDVQEMQIDLLAFPGHKALMGPQGTGVLYVRQGLLLEPLKRGGTGSESQNLFQPQKFPDRLESGTLNVPGIAGLRVAAELVMDEGIERIGDREAGMTEYLAEDLKK